MYIKWCFKMSWHFIRTSFFSYPFIWSYIFTYLIIIWNAFYYALVSSRTRALSTKWVTNTQQRLRQPSVRCAKEGSCVLSTSFPIQLEFIRRRERMSLVIVYYNNIWHMYYKRYYSKISNAVNVSCQLTINSLNKHQFENLIKVNSISR